MKTKLMAMLLAAGAMLGAYARTYTTSDFGKVVCEDGSVYATVADASSAGKTARAMIACVDGNYVLAIALADTSATGLLWGEAVESVGTWTADKAVAGGQWRMPSADDFKRIFTACQGYDYTNDLWDGMEYSWGNLQTLLSSAGGAQLDGLNSYWLSDEVSESNAYAYRTNLKQFFSLSKSGNWVLARPVLAFGAARTYKKVQLWENGPYWAETNIGADEPWDSGYYFWWGDTIGYKRVNDAWVAADGSSSNFEFYNNPISMSTCKAVATLRNDGWIITKDGENYLVPEHDAAHVQWGGDWRMPTEDDIEGLYDWCDWIWTTTNGVSGYIVCGRGEYASSSIFLPAAGYGDATSHCCYNSFGSFWSSQTYRYDTYSDSDMFYSKYLGFDSSYQSTESFYRYYGRPVRPVCPATADGDGVKPDVTWTVGAYFKATLAELGYDVPTDGQTAYKVVAYGLPSGLKLLSNKAVTKKAGKKTVVVTPANVEWWIEGVPTAALDYATTPPYLVITVNGVSETLPLSLGVEAQEVTELPDLALGDAINEQFYLEGVTNGWTVSGLPTGLKYTAKLLTTTKKKGKKVISVTTNALPYSVYGKTTKAGLFTITASKKTGGFNETMKYRVLVTPAAVDTSLFGEDLTNITTMAYVPIAWDLTGGEAVPSVPPVPFVPSSVGGKVAKVAGLPTGLAFAAADTYAYTNPKKKTGKYLKQAGQTIVGTPTKPGTYVVTFTKNVTTGTGKNKKTVAKTAQILWTVVANDAELTLGFNTQGGEVKNGSVGLNYGNLMAFSATDGATVTASGLPAGITLANFGGGAYAFKGFTAKAGTYLVTVKATLNGKTVTQRVALKVDGLPAWAKGTFNGSVSTDGDSYAGLATITVSSVGKISGKFQELGTNWTFSATCYTSRSAVDGYDDAFICTNVVAKYAYKVTTVVKGKKTTVTKYLTRTFNLTVAEEDDLNPARGMAMMSESGGSYVEAYQNLWGQTAYKNVGKKLFSSKSGKKTLAYKSWSSVEADGLGVYDTLSMKVTTAGAVTATYKYFKGTFDKKGAPQYATYTCSTTFVPTTPADVGVEAFTGIAHVFLPPVASTGFPGCYAEVHYPFEGREVPVPTKAALASASWFTGEFNGYGDAQFPVGGDTEFLNGLFTVNVASSLAFTGTFTGTDGSTASFSGTFAKDGSSYVANGVSITVKGATMSMTLSCNPGPYAGSDEGFGEMGGGSSAGPDEPCISLNCAWQNIWKRSDLAAEWKPAFATGTEKTIDLSETWLDNLVVGDSLTYAFGAEGAVSITGKIYGEDVSVTAKLHLEGCDSSTDTMHCNVQFIANGHLYQQQFTFPRKSTVAAVDIELTADNLVRLD